MSKRECNELFWQGFHPDDQVIHFPYLLDDRPNQLPGENLHFRELFDLAHPFFSRRRLTAEVEAQAKAKAKAKGEAFVVRERIIEQADENRELESMIRCIRKLSTHDRAYATLYRKCAYIRPSAVERLPRPESEPEPAQDVPPQRTPHSHQVLPESLSFAYTPPLPNITLPKMSPPLQPLPTLFPVYKALLPPVPSRPISVSLLSPAHNVSPPPPAPQVHEVSPPLSVRKVSPPPAPSQPSPVSPPSPIHKVSPPPPPTPPVREVSPPPTQNRLSSVPPPPLSTRLPSSRSQPRCSCHR